MDKIVIHDLNLKCILGVHEWERKEVRPVVIQCALFCDLSKAGATDQLTDTVDYYSINEKIIALVQNSTFALVESLASAIAAVCLAMPSVLAVDVEVEKLGAIRGARGVSIVLSRSKGSP